MEDLSPDPSTTNAGPSRTPHSLVSTLIISIFSCLFSIGCCYFALFSVSFRKGLITSANRIVEFQTECLKPIPSKYYFHMNYPIPCKTSKPKSHAKWTNAIVFSMESQYRIQGVNNFLLKNDDYVSFSEEHYAYYASQILNLSVQFMNERISQVLSNEKFIIGSPENIFFFCNDSTKGFLFNQTVMPESAPIASSTIFNPLEFTLNSIKRIMGIETIKRTLISTSRPLLVAFRVPRRKIWKYYENGEFYCPWNHSEKCHKFLLPPTSSLLINDITIGAEDLGDPVVMAIVGYNDNFMLHINASYFTKGGFLMRSVFLDNEHSREFFMNEITSVQESQLCIDDSNPVNWKSTSIECIKEKKSALKCNATEMICVDKRVCDTDFEYAYIDSNRFVKWKIGDEKPPIEIIIDFPQKYLYHFIRPKILTARNQFCGYSFIPYETVEEILFKYSGTFSFDVTDVPIKWQSTSFSEGKTSSKRYIYLKNSTHKIPSMTIRLPYDKIEL